MKVMLHIANGDSTAGSLREAGLPGEIGVFGDVLWDGPAPAGLDAQSFREVRARFISDCDMDEFPSALKTGEIWDRTVESAPAHDETVLWFEHDLHCQILLIAVLERLSRSGARVTMAPGDTYLGELRPSQLAELFLERTDVTARQFEIARSAWSAYTSPDPREFAALSERDDTFVLPHLAPAIRRHLEEFPSVTNGLARSEQQALRAAIELGPARWQDLFLAACQWEERRFMGDLGFLDVLRRLSPELITLDGESVSITETGRMVFEGRRNWLDIRPIDRWRGGVHLTANRPLWRWDSAAGKLRDNDSG